LRDISNAEDHLAELLLVLLKGLFACLNIPSTISHLQVYLADFEKASEVQHRLGIANERFLLLRIKESFEFIFHLSDISVEPDEVLPEKLILHHLAVHLFRDAGLHQEHHIENSSHVTIARKFLF